LLLFQCCLSPLLFQSCLPLLLCQLFFYSQSLHLCLLHYYCGLGSEVLPVELFCPLLILSVAFLQPVYLLPIVEPFALELIPLLVLAVMQWHFPFPIVQLTLGPLQFVPFLTLQPSAPQIHVPSSPVLC